MLSVDNDDKYWLSRSRFAELWRALVAINPIFVVLFVNGGILGTHTDSDSLKPCETT
jgi:hypothetical protein